MHGDGWGTLWKTVREELRAAARLVLFSFADLSLDSADVMLVSDAEGENKTDKGGMGSVVSSLTKQDIEYLEQERGKPGIEEKGGRGKVWRKCMHWQH